MCAEGSTPARSWRRLVKAVRRHQKRPLLAFVHVPKTAGTTIGQELGRSYAGHTSVEHWIRDAQVARPRVADTAFVAGHVNLPELADALAAVTERPIHYVTALRSPTDHVRSHYNYLIEIFNRGPEFYDPHGPAAKAISERIRSVDNTNPRNVIAQLDAAADLFLNFQSSYALGCRDELSDDELSHRLDAYDAIGRGDQVGAFVEWLTGTPAAEVGTHNSSVAHVPAEIFDDPEVQDFLAVRNAADIQLYSFVERQVSLPVQPLQLERVGP